MEQYSKDPAITQFMEMPCKCVCGNWHELHDGKLPPGKVSGELICPECYNNWEDEEND